MKRKLWPAVATVALLSLGALPDPIFAAEGNSCPAPVLGSWTIATAVGLDGEIPSVWLQLRCEADGDEGCGAAPSAIIVQGGEDGAELPGEVVTSRSLGAGGWLLGWERAARSDLNRFGVRLATQPESAAQWLSPKYVGDPKDEGLAVNPSVTLEPALLASESAIACGASLSEECKPHYFAPALEHGFLLTIRPTSRADAPPRLFELESDRPDGEVDLLTQLVPGGEFLAPAPQYGPRVCYRLYERPLKGGKRTLAAEECLIADGGAAVGPVEPALDLQLAYCPAAPKGYERDWCRVCEASTKCQASEGFSATCSETVSESPTGAASKEAVGCSLSCHSTGSWSAALFLGMGLVGLGLRSRRRPREAGVCA